MLHYIVFRQNQNVMLILNCGQNDIYSLPLFLVGRSNQFPVVRAASYASTLIYRYILQVCKYQGYNHRYQLWHI